MSDELTDDQITAMVHASVEKFLADDAAARDVAAKAAPAPPSALDRVHFRELLAPHVLFAGVLPASARHVLRDAESVFELRDGELVPRNNATDPSDPLVPLSPARWLQTLRESEASLFGKDGQPQ